MRSLWVVVALALCLAAPTASVTAEAPALHLSFLASTHAEPRTQTQSPPGQALGVATSPHPSLPTAPATVRIVPPAGGAPEICANGTPSNPFPVSFLPYGYLTPNLFGLGSGSEGLDDVCYTGGPSGEVSNEVNFSSVGGAEGVLGFPHVEYGQDLWGGSPGNMSPGFVLPESVSNATNSSLWLTNTYSINDTAGGAAYDYVWDNFLSSYVPNPGNVSGPTNYSLEVMLWMSTGLEGSPFTYFPYEGTASLPTLVNATLSDQPWDISHFCQGGPDNNSELTVLYFYNGTGGAMNATARTFGVNFSAVLVNINQMIRSAGITCWAYPDNNDVNLFLDDLNLGSEFLSPFPSPYYGEAFFDWNLTSMCFTFPQGVPTIDSVSCEPPPGGPLHASPSATPSEGTAPLTVAFNANPTGGVPPYTYNWSFGDGAYGSAVSPTHTYLVPGIYDVQLEVNDSNGSSVEWSVQVKVLPPPLTVTATASETSGFAPLDVEFGSTVAGGVPPYRYQWMDGNLSLGSGANATHSFVTAGVFSITLWVNDSSNSFPQTNRSTVSIQVTAVTTRNPGSPFSETEIILLGVGVLALAGGLLAAMRRPTQRPPSPDPGNPPAGPR